MKRLLSLILALSMVLTLLPAYASAEESASTSNDVIIDFDALPTGNTTTAAGLSTDGFSFEFNHMGLTTNNGYPGIEWRNNNTTNGVLRITLASSKLWPTSPTNRIAALDVTVPADGYYSVKFQGGLSNVSSKTSIFIDSTYASGKYSGGQYVGDYDFTTDDATTSSATAIDGTEKLLNTVYLTAGKHTIMFLHRTAETSTVYLFFKKLSFIYKGTVAPTATDINTALPTANMEVGDTENLTAKVKMSDDSLLSLGDYMSDGTADTVNVLNITSENTDVIEVTNVAKGGLCNSENTAYTITAKSGGTASLVYTLSLGGETVKTWRESVTVNEETVKLYAYALDGNGTVSVSGVTDVAVDKPTTVTAVPSDGYEFAYWTDANGDFVSEDKAYTFTPYTNTVLLAVFKSTTAATDEIGVDFFDGNRDYLGFVSATTGTKFSELQNKPTPGIVGYDFEGWSLDADTVINGRLTAVALYEETGKEVTGVTLNGTAVENTTYDAKVESGTVSGAKAWTRSIGGADVIVDFGTAYTYYVWDATDIKSQTTGAAAPLVVLDDPVDGAYMIEYDNGNLTALEAGILFGGESVSVDSCSTKVKVREIADHGQLTAKPNGKTEKTETYVRGYLIYKDAKGVIKTTYTSAAAISAAE